MKTELQKLGYSSHEIDVYLALLELGQTTVGPIIKKTSLHRQVVYNTLTELQNKKLVASVIKANRQNFTANDPNLILEKIDEKKKLAEKIIPRLIDLQTITKHQQEIKIYEGVDGFQSMHQRCIEAMPTNTFNNVIGGGGKKWYQIMKNQNFLNYYEKIRRQKRITTRLIGFANQKNEIIEEIQQDQLQGPKGLKLWRFLPDTYENPAGIQTYYQYVNIIIYDSKPLIAFQIKNKLVAKKFDQYFNILWRIAKPLSFRDLPLRKKMLK